ncbi:Carrier domain-containing protein [Trichoderma simmonsii]|uniref:Carrier domain-containing protein n=1 Tax=Trichoderma simmonsii TaxID=1491479 RepID=A0A8G0PD67_9HYPO|nr:Carrier domain-containing protein [Trichoderma simmonsii]
MSGKDMMRSSDQTPGSLGTNKQTQTTMSKPEPIAIIGTACRFAGPATSPSKLWDLLKSPQNNDLRRPVDDRFSTKGFHHRDGTYHGHTNATQAYLLDSDPAYFDADFFSVKPVEARALDPQQRLLLEVVYESLEAAGLPMRDLRGSDTGVFVGAMVDDYAAMLLRDLDDTPTYAATGTARSILANRISYAFDWHGPSVSLDTACSSSLVAVHMAVQTLRAGDSRVALACGSNIILGPENFVTESKLSMLSPDGQSRMWDAGANGYARGDGVAAVVLKTLSAALADGDHIECIIRETGLNQDGATPGITMPSSSAQEALIRQTYAKAGLDIVNNPEDRCQYFEAHGTGTPAGDPVEAKAIHDVFSSLQTPETPLYTGSIKTVLGHTEGTAGLAAVIKASLAIQHGSIPPNLLFNKLSDRVAPFYKNLEIATVAKPWPKCSVRRASCNSFGFGGANAHAILESYQEDVDSAASVEDTQSLFTPFVFSASSEASLRANLDQYREFLATDNAKALNIGDLAWTLRQRRSTLGWRASVTVPSPPTVEALLSALEDAPTVVKALPVALNKVLGVFTGQGAQWPRMGAGLIQQSKAARDFIQELDQHLSTLGSDAPDWSLEKELLSEASSSRVHEAAFSQPLCTAVQLLVVHLLRNTGVRFSAAVGHSSGEIAAAHAAGFLSARDAICIAYYRGLHLARLNEVQSASKQQGAMLAVGTSPEDAAELVSDDMFKGRIVVAAVNSATSVTISGDLEAIKELEIILQDEGTFNRRLKVDKAYHSHHMLPLFEPYVASLQKCGISPLAGEPDCTWFSSVHSKPVAVNGAAAVNLSDKYWAENLVQPVQFLQALTLASEAKLCDVLVEVGPHAALKGPTTHTIGNAPHHGSLARGSGDVESLSSLVGFLWSYLPPGTINIDAYERAITGQQEKRFKLVKNLPSYSWNHNTRFWHESRVSKKLRTRPENVHPLLGHAAPHSSPHDMSWNHRIRVSELDWLEGHRVQDQIILPAAGYVCTAIEAARQAAGEASIRLIDVYDFVIHQAVAFDQEDDARGGIEILVSLSDIERTKDHIRARFVYSIARPQRDDNLQLAASATVDVLLGEPDKALLPAKKNPLSHAIEVDPEPFYSALLDLGYGFSGRFQSLSELRRKNRRSGCQMRRERQEDEAGLLIHPIELDAALQSVMLAHSYPYDQELTIMHLPTTIRHVRLNPACWGAEGGNVFPIESQLTKANASGITGQSAIYSASTPSHAAVQLQDATFLPLGAARIEERKVFSKVDWIPSLPDGIAAATLATESDSRFIRLLERISIYYLRQFDRDVSADSPKRREAPESWYLNFAKHVVSVVDAGQHKWAEDSWKNDTRADLDAAAREAGLEDTPDVQIMHLVGTQMPRVFAGETTMIEQFRADGSDILDRYYAGGFGFRETADWVGQAVKQLVDRYPHLNMLEIGAGTGSATKAVFGRINKSFKSYTYTDLSPSFFERAGNTFSTQKDRMIFKTLDIGRDPAAQGFATGTYDLVVAYLVLHATPDLEVCIANARKLLRPGGFLVVGEGLDAWDGIASGGFIFGPLDGWWLGAGTHENRTLSPHVTAAEWDRILRKTGFSGIDARTPVEFEGIFSKVGFVAQAVDDTVRFLRQPIEAPRQQDVVDKLVLVGGKTPRTEKLIKGLSDIFTSRKLARQVHHFTSLQTVDHSIADASSTVLSLSELDMPVFEDITLRNDTEAFEGVRRMFGAGKTLLWVTNGRVESTPFSNMTVGFGRVAENETPDLFLQQLDVIDPDSVQPEVLAEALLRLHHFAAEKNSGRDTSGTVWSSEPEVIIEQNGRQLLARIRPISEVNDRYMSARRTVTRQRDLSKQSAAVVLESTASAGQETGPTVALREFPGQNPFIESLSDAGTTVSEASVELQTVLSTSSAIRCGALGYMFVVLGAQADGKRYLVLSSSLAPRLRVPVSSAVAVPDNGDDSTTLAALSAHLIATEILRPLTGLKAVLVAHNPPPLVSVALRIQSEIQGIQVVFTTDSADGDDSWIRLPPFVTQSDMGELLQQLPAIPSAFVGFSSQDGLDGEATLVSALQSQNRSLVILSTDALSSSVGTANRAVSPDALGTLLSKALADVKASAQTGYPAPITERLEDLVEGTARLQEGPESLSLIDWTVSSALPVRISRLDAKPMFKADKTYWVVGMSRALGLALADWMIDAGVKTLVMTSRTPDISADWLAMHERKGVKVVVLPCDVTDEAALHKAHAQIVSTLPEIVGVIHGAMVLRDTSILKMTFDQLIDVLRPKIIGGLNLDRLFATTNLDFFVLVSSINCVIGNHGQANYAAANTFLCGLAGARRKRGLRAATVNGGAILGAGYMQRELARGELDAIVRRYRMMRMSDGDWCQSICEGIDACRLESIVGPELTTSIADVDYDEAGALDAPLWCKNPKFSAFVVVNDGRDDQADVGNVATASVGERLRQCQSLDDAREVVKEAFAAQVRTALGLDASTTDQELMASRSTDLGIDSLVSVDLHSWFLRNLQVNVPTLSIMGSGSLADLVQHAVENLPTELLAASDDSSAQSSGGSTPSRTSGSATSVSDEGDKKARPAEISVDWEAETKVPADMLGELVDSRVGGKPTATGVVILTGCTGLLGRHLLRHLLAHPSVTQVHCLAVRNLDQRLAKGSLPSNPRAVYHAGDLGKPFFGLSESTAQSVFDSAFAVIHCGADTSHVKHFMDVRASNLGSTMQIARECLRRHIPMYYVSSAGLGMLHKNSKEDGFPAAHIDIPEEMIPDGTEGYMCSKWASEKFLEQACALTNLRVEIHRPSTIVREGSDAVGDEAEKDWVNAFIKYARILGAAPESRRNRGFMDLVLVDTVCNGIIGRMFDDSQSAVVVERNDVTYFNEVGDEVLALDGLKTIGQNGEPDGEALKVLPREEWTKRAVAAGLHPGVGVLIETMDEAGVNYPRLWRGMSGRRV